MESARRGYKLQEFVAHASDVNCLNIGKKSCRVFVTGGVDRKVNLWAIGQPTALLNLPGHTSSVESVTFDSAEVLVLAGAYSGTIKLWDLEEAKLVRTLTGHRSSCTSVEFHPFGEFFASGSLDTDLKIWDIRRKGCIHTYQGHTRAVKTVKFTPDGRWVVSGGEDNVIKLWDLTAGKLLHEFKFHTGPIQSIDFHPHEFLLASGSADRTVKFWDLETFELIGSAGPEVTGVRSMIFHPDGKALFCGLDETLKVFSWEPIRCHDVVDMRWSILGDLSIYEGKLLGCSYHQSSVGVWVADISLIAPYAINGVPRATLNESTGSPGKGHELHYSSLESNSIVIDKDQGCEGEMNETIKRVYVTSNDTNERISQSMDTLGTSNTNQKSLIGFMANKCSIQNRNGVLASKISPSGKDSSREVKPTESCSGAPRRIESSFPPRRVSHSSSGLGSRNISIPKDSRETTRGNRVRVINSSVSMPVIMPRDTPNLQSQSTIAARKEPANADNVFDDISFKRSHMRKSSYSDIGTGTQKEAYDSFLFHATPGDLDADVDLSCQSMHGSDVNADPNEKNSVGILANAETFNRILSPERPSTSHNDKGSESVCLDREKGPVKYIKGVAVQHGRTRSLVESWEKFNGRYPTDNMPISTMTAGNDASSSNVDVSSETSERDLRSNDDCTASLLQAHDSFINIVKSRLTKLQMVRHLLSQSGMKGAIAAVAKLPDHPVQADVVGILMRKTELFNLDLFSSVLPLLAGLLSSKTERHLDVSLEMLVKLTKTFLPVIRSTISATSVGIDIQAEERRNRCQLCSKLLENIKKVLPPLIKKGGSVAKHALELNLALDG